MKLCKLPYPNRPGEDVYLWNIDYKVGRGGATRGQEVKLVQFLLFRWSRESKSSAHNDTGKVDGIWSTKSSFTLYDFQNINREGFVDEVINPFPPGQIMGHKSNKYYAIVDLQIWYVCHALKVKNLVGSSVNDINAALLNIADCTAYDGDMPRDLRITMNSVRDRFIKNLHH